MKTHKTFEGIKPFKMDVTYSEINSASPLNTHDHHIHDRCEIYINLSGDVSFVVENSFYPIMPGNIIITRPYEYHHCVYHSDKIHKHFCLFVQSSDNKELFDIFYNREPGKKNLIVLEPEKSDELVRICHKLKYDDENSIDKYFRFFNMMHLLNDSHIFNAPNNAENNSIIIPALDYINTNFRRKISVNDLAKNCNISVSTLERHFLNTFNLNPSEYVKKRRLANATKMLSEGYSITDAAYHSGFSDCSSFIVLFKKEYNITPLKYKKTCISKNL